MIAKSTPRPKVRCVRCGRFIARWEIGWWVADKTFDPPQIKGPIHSSHIVKKHRDGLVA